jgi:hypothetical protein
LLFNNAVSIKTKRCQMISECGAAGDWELVRETKILGENPPQCQFVHRKSHIALSRIKTGPLQLEAGLSYSMAPLIMWGLKWNKLNHQNSATESTVHQNMSCYMQTNKYK